MPADRVFDLARWPALATNEHMATWFRIQVNLGLAPRTLTAYARGLENFVRTCVELRVDPVTADRTAVAEWVHRLSEQRGRHGDDVVALDSGWGLANATIQQRLTSVRLFYDFLIEERIREDNPVGRGRYTPRRAFGRGERRGLVPRFRRLPWIPTEEQWLRLLEAAAQEPIRNRLMLAVAYDAGLRREELCLLETGDVDPAPRTLTVRAETTKTRSSRVVPYSVPTGQLLVAYLAHRRELEDPFSSPNRAGTRPSRSRRGRGRRSSGQSRSGRTSRSSAATPSVTSVSRISPALAGTSTRSHASRDTAALDTTAQYIQLSARDLAGKLQGAMSAIHAWRIAMVDEQIGAGDDR